MSASEWPGLVIGISAPGAADAALCSAVSGAGALGVLDLGRGDRLAREALSTAVHAGATRPIGIRVSHSCGLTVADFVALLGDRPDAVGAIVLGWQAPWQLADIPERFFVLVEVTSADEALLAAELGADGLILRGHEAGGKVGALSSFVLLQKVVADPKITIPVWVCGGIGPNTAAGAVVAGAAGVVLDTQLGLLPEAELPAQARAVLANSDGTGSVIVGGHRVLLDRTARDVALDLDESTAAARIGTRDPRTDLLPFGQDAYLAQRFAERYGSVSRAIRAVIGAVHDALRPAAPALAEGSAFSRALDVALPVAQGPMTRVSDQAAFAAAVAKDGGLPFIALALSTAEQTRTMMEQTRELLGDKPWGVGVLGFAPEEVRTGQLAVIKELLPPVALIAGGRPDQAKALEDLGIKTFLHVPSSGLLSQFVAAGARRFVFEGSECGGHVGPTSSFALWEAQVGVLLDAVDGGVDAGELQILFAGGIHDARSAATVAAVADPLSRKGAGVGVLMGTGYLFTEEAVTCGAVQPLFQQQVIAADRTELLKTAPGHVTRAVSSPFTDEFYQVGADLLAQGVPEREVWDKLERLNTGRLRIASKGLRREGPELVSVDEGGQLAEGLFMAGDVVVLRSAATTIAALHNDVTAGATAHRSARSAQLASTVDVAAGVQAPPPLDIAIVGMSAIFPGADGVAAFWSSIVAGSDAVTEVPAERWDAATYYHPDGGPGRTPSKWGGFLPRIPFDPLSYGIPPATLAAIEPVQLLALEAARRALVDAGYPDGGPSRERTSVVFGAEQGSDLNSASTLRMGLPEYIGDIPKQLADQLPELTEDSFPGRLANVISGRIANRLDLGGSNFTVDAACASSLAAVDIGCKELVAGTSDMVLCGGADLHNAIDDYLLFSSVGALSSTGRCRTFDSSADGIALGEGVAVVALKRLADAERDGDRVYAVITGVGSGSDGKALGLTAPRPEGQRRAVERAYANARISPWEVGIVEAHGTGTVVGDRTELSTLDTLFTEAGAAPGSCAIGSVKSQIGHTKCAAGLAGLIKATLAVHTGVKPPTLHVTAPNAAWDPATSPFVFNGAAVPWTQPPAERIAGVSAFGFGGTNFHVVVRGHAGADAVRHGIEQWPAELLTFRGNDLAAAQRQVERLQTIAATNDAHGRPWTLRDLARTAAERSDRDRSPVRVAIVAHDLDELSAQLRAARQGQPAGGVHYSADTDGKLAVLFPGQGSQRPGMLSELFVAFPELGRIARAVGMDTSVIFPPSAFAKDTKQAQSDRLRDTRVAQPALGLTGLAVHHLLSKLGVAADAYAGHSYGELVALAAAGAIDAPTLMALSTARADSILGAAGVDPGTMAAVSAGHDQVAAVLASSGLAGQVVIANNNAPSQVVVSGPTAAVDQAVAALRAAGLSATPIPVACAFHSPVVAGASAVFADVLEGVRIGTAEVPVWSNRTAQAYPTDPAGVRAELAAQIAAPVRFADQIEAMYADGARVFLEAGAGKVLSGLVGRILGDRPHTVITCDGGGLAGLLDAVARLAVAGSDVRTGWLFAGRDARDVSSATPPKRAGWTVNGAYVQTVDGQYLAGGLKPARKVALETSAPAVVAAAAPAAVAAPVGRDDMVSDFLRTSRELIAAQRDVLLGYLGAPVQPAIAQPVVARPAVAQPAVAQPAVVQPVAPRALPAATPVAAQTPAKPDALATVLSVIAARTGYPVEMIDPNVDLEADLSVDSIKRTEIAGEVAARLGVSTPVDELVKARTASALAQILGAGSAAPSAARVSAPAREDALTAVLAVIAARTGYPVEMIDPNVDLEADLSVDSIKRTEIAGEVAARLGVSTPVDELVKARTASALAQILGAGSGAPVLVAAAPAREDALTVVLSVIAARTGYPVEMIDPNVDLEADLSVDSIKRTEIAGEVAARLGVSTPVDELVKARTASALAQILGAGSAAPAAAPAREDALTVVLSVIAARTGYPVEMIDPSVDLEADLSVDSIKRTEIAGEVAARLGVSTPVDELVKARTASALAQILNAGSGAQSAAHAPARSVPAGEDALSAVLSVIAARTGYPVEMIDPNVDLEADLSVDSIKRTEIAGEVVSRLGASTPVDELVKARTASAMAQLLGAGAVAPVSVGRVPVGEDALSAVLSVIAARTGYPVEMIDPNVDLEADLSVDSIKRTEIAGEVVSRLGVSTPVDELVKARTASAMAQLLGGGAVAPVASVQAPANALVTIIEVIAARTGYPVEMIDPNVDLEADLSVDSIKRTEIAGEVVSRLGVSTSVDELVKARTASAMAQVLGTGAPVPVAGTFSGDVLVPTDALTTVIEVIAARTGYPVEMIDPAVDLEADLSVDSIKRTEIAGDVVSRLGSSTPVDELVKARTAAAMAAILTGTAVAEPVAVAQTAAPVEKVSGGLNGSPARRFLLELVDSAAEADGAVTSFVGAHILISGGDPVLAEELADALSARGAMAEAFSGRAPLPEYVQRVDGLISLHALGDDEPVMPTTFPLIKSVLALDPRWVLAVSRPGLAAAGLRGLFRSLQREYPSVITRHVELDDSLVASGDIAEALVTEMLTSADEPTVAVSVAGRKKYDVVQTSLGALALTGAGPAGTGVAEAEAIGLHRDSVILLVGGARGITAQFAVALAQATRCRIELAGRTALSNEPEPPTVAAAADLPALRAALAGLGQRDLAAIDRQAKQILAQREVTDTVREIVNAGGTADYHTLDVRDGEALRHLIKQVHAEHGRLDGVVYAAGVIEDKLVAEKDPQSFDRVYRTKVDGAAALLAELTDIEAKPRFAVFFGSIAAASGNRGQTDYAAANDALESMGAEWAQRTGNRAITVHWGPWAPVGAHSGMVSAELGRSYAQRGIELLDPEDGVASLLRELAWGDPNLHSVVYTASEW